MTITEVYFSAAKYKGTECKYVEPFGTDLTLKIGGGKQNFSFVRSAKVWGYVKGLKDLDCFVSGGCCSRGGTLPGEGAGRDAEWKGAGLQLCALRKGSFCLDGGRELEVGGSAWDRGHCQVLRTRCLLEGVL